MIYSIIFQLNLKCIIDIYKLYLLVNRLKNKELRTQKIFSTILQRIDYSQNYRKIKNIILDLIIS